MDGKFYDIMYQHEQFRIEQFSESIEVDWIIFSIVRLKIQVRVHISYTGEIYPTIIPFICYW